MKTHFHSRTSVEQVEEGRELAPKFDAAGHLPVVTTDYATGELLMHAYMNAEALQKTIETGEAHYWSRSRGVLWRKGATSGLIQRVREMRIDDDQDCVWLRVDVADSGASCHVGYRSCFYRRVPIGPEAGRSLSFTESEKTFDPREVYGEAPNYDKSIKLLIESPAIPDRSFHSSSGTDGPVGGISGRRKDHLSAESAASFGEKRIGAVRHHQ